MRRLWVFALLALSLAACDGGDDPERDGRPTADRPVRTPAPEPEPPRPSADDPGAVESLLADRAKALGRRDAQFAAATATGPQRAIDAALVQRSRRLGVRDVRYAIIESDIGEERAAVLAEITYRLRGHRRPQVAARRIALRKEGTRWRVARDRPLGAPLPWEVAAFRPSHSRHVLVLAAPAARTGQMRGEAETAYRRIRRMLPRRGLPAQVIVIAARDAAQMAAVLGVKRVPAGIDAISNVIAATAGPALAVDRVFAQRVVVRADRWAQLTATQRGQLLTHEMTHAALAADTSGRTPSWLAEAVAMHVSRDDRRPEHAARLAGAGRTISLRRISGPNTLTRLPLEPAAAGYALASAAGELLVEEHGTDGLFELFDAFGDPDIPGRPGARTTDRVLRRSLGLSLAQLERRLGVSR